MFVGLTHSVARPRTGFSDDDIYASVSQAHLPLYDDDDDEV